MVKIDVEVYNEKKDTEKVKEFRVDYCNDCDSVVVELGNESFVIDYATWKAINRFITDKHDGDIFEEDFEMECEEWEEGVTND